MTGRNAQGLPTYVGATARTFRCRVTGPVQSIRSKERGEYAQLFTAWVDTGSYEIGPDDRVTMPTDFSLYGSHPLIFSVNRVTDEHGLHHTKLTFGFMYHRQGQT